MCGYCAGYGESCPQCRPEMRIEVAPEQVLTTDEFLKTLDHDATVRIVEQLIEDAADFRERAAASERAYEELVRTVLVGTWADALGTLGADEPSQFTPPTFAAVLDGTEGGGIPSSVWDTAEAADNAEREDDAHEEFYDQAESNERQALRRAWSEAWVTYDQPWCIVYHTSEPSDDYVGGRTMADAYRAPYSSHEAASQALESIREAYPGEIADRYRVVPFREGRALSVKAGIYYEDQ